MKKIIMSIAMIAAVGALVVGATGAFFTDSEVSTGNTFTAGTIDIAIDGENPWTTNYTTGDLKPCETGYINFEISNVGLNPVNVSKSLFNFVNDGGVISEPECEMGGGDWNSASGICEGNYVEVDEVQSQIFYDLTVEVFDASDALVWWQAIYEEEDAMSITDVYGLQGGAYVEMGMIPVGGLMKVEQSYHFACEAGNEYQGDILTFDMEILGEQLTGADGYAATTMENKEKGGDGIWDIVQGDGIKGTLQYKTQGENFDYTMQGKAPLANTDYVLLVGENPWELSGEACVAGTDTSDGLGNVDFAGQVDCGSMQDAKAWLALATDWNGGTWVAWSESSYLFETALVDYLKN